MQVIKEAAIEVSRKIQSNTFTKGDLTILAQDIAHASLESFRGKLLHKALALAECLVDFEDEYQRSVDY